MYSKSSVSRLNAAKIDVKSVCIFKKNIFKGKNQDQRWNKLVLIRNKCVCVWGEGLIRWGVPQFPPPPHEKPQIMINHSFVFIYCRQVGRAMASKIRELVSKNKTRYTDGNFDLDLTCILTFLLQIWMYHLLFTINALPLTNALPFFLSAVVQGI